MTIEKSFKTSQGFFIRLYFNVNKFNKLFNFRNFTFIYFRNIF